MHPFTYVHMTLYIHIYPFSPHMHICSYMQMKKCIHMSIYTYAYTHRHKNVYCTVIHIYAYSYHKHTYIQMHICVQASMDHTNEHIHPHRTIFMQTSIFTNIYTPHIHMIHSIYMSMHPSIHRDPHMYRHRQRYFAFCAHHTELKSRTAA